MGSSFEQLRRSRVLFGGLAGGLVGLVCLLVFLVVRSPRDTVILELQPDPHPNEVRVWVGGEVARPGLYILARGARVADALEAAGGVLESAETSGLGLAAPVEDADQVIVPARQPANMPSAPPSGTQSGETAVTGGVNINSASAMELDTLPGIGEALSARIIEYREQHGPFQSVDELAEVSGISERMVDELRELITVGT